MPFLTDSSTPRIFPRQPLRFALCALRANSQNPSPDFLLFDNDIGTFLSSRTFGCFALIAKIFQDGLTLDLLHYVVFVVVVVAPIRKIYVHYVFLVFSYPILRVIHCLDKKVPILIYYVYLFCSDI
jgi:hypothetical protein